MKNKALLIHHDYYEAVKMLTPYEAGVLFQAVFDYDINGIEPEFEDRTLAVIFLQMKRLLDANRERYEKISKSRSENAKKRWDASEREKNKNVMQMHNLAVNTNTNANANENSNTNISVNVNEKTTAEIPEKESAEESAEKQTHKKAYGEFKNVFLSAEEYKKLSERYPDSMQRIESLSAYIKSTGKNYLDHYAQLINWQLFTKNETALSPKMKPPGERREPTFDISEFTKKAIGIKYVPPRDD